MLESDVKLRNHLRNMPTGYLVDLLVDQAAPDESTLREVLWERGFEEAEVERMVHRRQHSRLPRGYLLWRTGRNLAAGSTVLISLYNVAAFCRLLASTQPLRNLLLTLAAGCILFGFFLGFKLSTHIYQGTRHQLFCGFPIPVGWVDLETGEENIRPKLPLLLALVGNALVGVTVMLFPLLFLSHLLIF